MLVRVVLVLALFSPLSGQKILWQSDGVAGQYRFGLARVVGDLNGDGWEDVATFVTTAGSVENNELWFLSGRDGTTLRRRPEYAPGWVYQSVARAGDMSGDGVPDYVFRAYNVYANFEGVVEVANGVDDAPLWRIGPSPGMIVGLTLLGELDLDGDRRPDIVAGDFRDRTKAIHAYDNAGRVLYTVAIPPELTALGGNSPGAFASLGDFDGDGADDYVVGAATKYLASSGIAILSGRTGQIQLLALTARFAFAEFVGDTVAPTDDLDGDGVSEIYAGSFGIPGVLVLFSGRTGKELRSWPNPEPSRQSFVSSLRAVDLDRDGVRDALIGAPYLTGEGSNLGRVIAYSGRDGGLQFDLRASRPLGVGIDLLRGPSDDPFSLFVTTMPDCCPNTQSDGRVLLYRAKPATVTLPGAPPCQGGLPGPAEIGLRDLKPSGKRGVRVHLSEAPPGVNAALFVGLSNTDWNGVPLPLDLAFANLPGCALHTSIDAFALRTTGTAGLDRGYAFVDLPFDLSMTGRRVYAQWLLFGPGNTWPGGLTRPLSWQLAL